MIVFQGLSILQETHPQFTYVESLKFQMQPWDLWPFFTLEKTPTSQASIQRHPSTTTGIRKYYSHNTLYLLSIIILISFSLPPNILTIFLKNANKFIYKERKFRQATDLTLSSLFE